MKKKLIISTLLLVTLALPSIVYGSPSSVEKSRVDVEQTVENKDKKHDRVMEYKNGKKYEELLEVQGLSANNKKLLQEAFKKKVELKKEIISMTKEKHDNKKDFEDFKLKARAIRDKVVNKEITEEEGKKQLDDLRQKHIESSELWKNLSENGKNQMLDLEKQFGASRENNKNCIEEYKKAVESKNESQINSSAEKLIQALNNQNELMQRKIDILKKELKQ